MTDPRSPARPEDVIREALELANDANGCYYDHPFAALDSLVARQQELEARLAEHEGEPTLQAPSSTRRYWQANSQGWQKRAEAAEARLAEAEREMTNLRDSNSALQRSAIGNRDGRWVAEARLRQTEQALREWHEATCGCDRPGNEASCVADPLESAAALDAQPDQRSRREA